LIFGFAEKINFFLTFLSYFPIRTFIEAMVKMLKKFFLTQAVGFSFFSFIGLKVCLKVS